MAILSQQESRDLLTLIATKLELPKHIKDFNLSIGIDKITEITVTYYPEGTNNDLQKPNTGTS